MRVLLIGPDHDNGSLSPYLTQLTASLRNAGTHVDRLSSESLPYDTKAHRFWPVERVLETASQLLARADLTAYDLLSIHFGNLELEQVLPVLWSDRPRPPAVYHAHTTEPTLFRTHLRDQPLHQAVVEAARSVDGLVYFGGYAQRQIHHLYEGIPAEIAWWPTTIPTETRPHLPTNLAEALDRPEHVPLVSVYGFASPWKNAESLIRAAENLDHRTKFILAGPFWDDPTQAGTTLNPGTTRLNRYVDLTVVPTYLDASARLALLHASDLGVFPYQHHHTFQGSGAIGDYLGHGIPVIATDIANMAEVISASGLVVPPDEPAALRQALATALGDNDLLTQLRRAAHRRAGQFSIAEHGRRCLAFYQAVADCRTRSTLR